MSEARVDRLEADVGEIKTTLAGLVPLIIRIDERLNSTLPHLATKAELTSLEGVLKTDLMALDGKLSAALASKPSHGYFWLVIGTLIAAQALIAAVLAVVLSWPHVHG